MRCKECGHQMVEGELEFEDSGIMVIGLICKECLNFKFDKKIVNEAIKEYKHYLKLQPLLKLKRKITTIGGNKKGFYFPDELFDSLNMKIGEEILIHPLDKKKIMIERIS